MVDRDDFAGAIDFLPFSLSANLFSIWTAPRPLLINDLIFNKSFSSVLYIRHSINNFTILSID